jgi:two-component system sensor kinase FixL
MVCVPSYVARNKNNNRKQEDGNMNNPALPGFEELRRQAEKIIENSGEGAEVFARDILGLMHDLETQNAELRQSQKELEKSRNAYRNLYDDAPVGYVLLNKEGTVLMANAMACNMLRLTSEEMIGQGFSRFIHPSDHDNYSGLVTGLTDTVQGKRTGEIRLIGGGESAFPVRVESSGSWEDGQGFCGWRMVLLDISEQKNSEEKLKKYAQKLERSNQELQDFAFIASHDLNEPLRKIQAFGELLQRKFAPALGPDGLEYVERMRGATKRLQDMIKGLLAYSRVVTTGAGFVPVDLGLLVRDVLSDLEWQIEKSGATVTLESLPTLEVDPNQMRQLFQNLISNALKFRRQEPILIKIFGRPHAVHKDEKNEVEYLDIIVEDNGIGFEDIHAERIFSLFERLHGRSAYEGTGMGLAICRRIVERHGGCITACGVPGKGATFMVALPIKPQ